MITIAPPQSSSNSQQGYHHLF